MICVIALRLNNICIARSCSSFSLFSFWVSRHFHSHRMHQSYILFLDVYVWVFDFFLSSIICFYSPPFFAISCVSLASVENENLPKRKSSLFVDINFFFFHVISYIPCRVYDNLVECKSIAPSKHPMGSELRGDDVLVAYIDSLNRTWNVNFLFLLKIHGKKMSVYFVSRPVALCCTILFG